MTLNTIITVIYYVLGLSVFLFGSLLVYKNLKKINRIEGEKFNLSDLLAMIGFGFLFSITILFMVNLTFQVLSPDKIPSIAHYILVIMLSVLIIYPLWEIIFLGRPTSDAVHDFHKFLESKILDRFRGGMAYLVSFGIFILIYIVPVLVIYFLTDYQIIQIAFMWFLVFPLFFLNYFAANGIVNGIIRKTYKHTVKNEIRKNSHINQNKFKSILSLVMIAIAWIPFLLNFYNFANPIIRVFQNYEFSEKDKYMGYISLITTIPFGIKGFFSKFWNKKSKTKTIDYLFAGYIFIAIGINMLINFVKIDKGMVNEILGKLDILESLIFVFENYSILVPLIVVQSFITLVYGIAMLVQKSSNFKADVKTQATTTAYSKININKILRRGNVKIKEKKKNKIDFLVLYKSLLLEPCYSRYGIDLNEQVRRKAAQYLYLASVDDEEDAKKIINFIFKYSLSDSDKNGDQKYISKESINVLGEIGEIYPELVTDRLIAALTYTDVILQRYILDALGDIGESKKNISNILEKIDPLFRDDIPEVRKAAFSALSEMLLEGKYQDKEFVDIILKKIYEILDDYKNVSIIDSCLESLVKMSIRIANDIEFEKIIPFLNYNEGENLEKTNFIIQNTIVVLGYMVYYNVEKFEVIIADLTKYLEDKRNFIRLAAVDALGNYILKSPENKKEELLKKLLLLSLDDPDPDVRSMCVESIAEFLIIHKGYKVNIDGKTISILDFYLDKFTNNQKQISENISEALKLISPLYEENIYPILEDKIIKQENLELVRDCLHVLAVSGKEEHIDVDLKLIYQLVNHKEASIRGEALFLLGCLSSSRNDIDEAILEKGLEDQDPQNRQEAIFALGKLGIVKPNKITEILISNFFKIDRESEKFISEVELYAESLGEIGSFYPSNEIIISLQSTLIGNTNPLAKDVIARSLGKIGYGMIRSGNAVRRIESSSFYNQISWLKSAEKKEYTIGNLIIIFIDALQLKGIPDSVMDEISDSIQDLLPVFIHSTEENEKGDEILETIKQLLAQAYYSNYNDEILETIDRIDSLLSFKRSFTIKYDFLKQSFEFYSKQFTTDGKQFLDQGDIFMLMQKEDPIYLDYALKSYEISVELAPFESFTPNALMNIGKIYKLKQDFEKAKDFFDQALEFYTSLDDIKKMDECETYKKELH